MIHLFTVEKVGFSLKKQNFVEPRERHYLRSIKESQEFENLVSK